MKSALIGWLLPFLVLTAFPSASRWKSENTEVVFSSGLRGKIRLDAVLPSFYCSLSMPFRDLRVAIIDVAEAARLQTEGWDSIRG